MDTADGRLQAAQPRTAGSNAPELAHGLGYRPALDGLRALAVLAVLAYHSGILRSGWIGVDLFFALSGYLITGLLLAELDRTGTIGLRRFWTRRFRRLLPGVVLLLGFIALLGGLSLPDWTPPHLDDVIGTATYSSNWIRVVGERSYWDLFRTPGPLEHVWSLAVEEQFYLVWPVVLLLVAKFRRSWLMPVTAGLVLLTAGLQVGLSLSGSAIERIYVGTDTRAPAFLLGALFVMIGDRGGRPARWATYTVPVGIAWLLAACVLVDGQAPATYRGVLLAVSLLGAITVAGAARLDLDSPIGRFLRWAPLHCLGRWSYGIYLFHWPVAVALRDQQMLGIQRFGLIAGISLGLAAASYEFLEHPIRLGGVPNRWRIPALACSAAILLAACGNVAPEAGRDLDAETRAELLAPLPAPAGAGAGAGAAAQPNVAVVQGSSAPADSTTTSAPPATTEPSVTAPPSTRPVTDAAVASGPFVADPENALARPADGARVLVLGDSVPFQIAVAWAQAGAVRDIAVAVRAAPGCTPSTTADDHYRNDTRDVCSSVQDNLEADLATYRPAALVVYYGLAGQTVTQDGQVYDACAEQGAATLRAQLQRLVDLGKAAGATVFLTPPANPPAVDWLDFEAQSKGAACYRAVYEQMASADRAGIRLLHIDQFVCPGEPTSCPPDVYGVRLRADGIHFSEDGTALVLPWILDRLFIP